MFDSIYVGTSGLNSFSEGLSNISNNVANMNTPGFKSSGLAFLDLYYRYESNGGGGSPYSQGSGVQAGSTFLKFTQGEFRETGNNLDVAIDGNGFFILNKDGKTFYTRSGQFTIDEDGFLTAQDDGARVEGLSGGGVADINISGKRSNPPVATSTLTFSDSLSNSDTTFEVANITAFDSLGKQHQLTLKLTNDSSNISGRWTFQLMEGATVVTTGEVRYDGSGVPQAGFETFTFSYSPSGASATSLTLDFSGTNFFSSSASSLKFASQNGRAAGFLSKTTIDTDGFLTLAYSNGQTIKDRQLAIATFTNLAALEAQGGSRYTLFGKSERMISAPGQSAAGKLKVSGIELSNVNLSQEFSELIIVQRAYQASSQVVSAANEMIQQLGEIRGRR
jgi:flagellar hook protein FlgE